MSEGGMIRVHLDKISKTLRASEVRKDARSYCQVSSQNYVDLDHGIISHINCIERYMHYYEKIRKDPQRKSGVNTTSRKL